MYTYIVTGPHRSGTSMMMRCLEAAGMAVNYRHIEAVTHPEWGNPNGYYEGAKECVPGLVTKRVWYQLRVAHFKPYHKLWLLEMARPEEERRVSLEKFPHFTPQQIEDRLLVEPYKETFVRRHPEAKILTVQYHDVLADPRKEFERIAQAGWPLIHVGKACDKVDPNLYRSKR